MEFMFWILGDISNPLQNKLFYLMFYFGRQYSSLLLILMSLEKCLSVYFPLKSKAVCTVNTAIKVSVITGIILAGYNSIHFLAMEYRFLPWHGRHICPYMVSFKVFEFLKKVDNVLFLFGPFILLSVFNVAIVFKFMRAKYKNNSTEHNNESLTKSATRGTAMVVTVSVAFLILTAPTAAFQAIPQAVKLGNNPLYSMLKDLGQFLSHSINFVLYTAVESRFRKEFLKLIFRKKSFDSTSSSRSSNMDLVASLETRCKPCETGSIVLTQSSNEVR